MRDKKNEARDIPISFDGEERLEANSEDGSDKPPGLELASGQSDQLESVEAAPEEVDAPEPDEPQQDQFAQQQAEIKALMAEKASLYDKLVRRQAEFENYRKRVERERSETYQHGRDDVLLQFLPVVDNFERALSSLETSEGDAEALRHGVELIHKQFKDALSKFGLEPVEAVGRAFDPHVHEAVTTEATDKHEENTVIEEFQRGYRIGDRLLRPAKVKVASSPEK
ncbi:MAG: nucleotide exchange factor GrpE [Acidobacteriota bacterium]